MPRPRKHDSTIPDHIDQAALPAGIYWDRSGKGRWYVFFTAEDGKRRAKTIAGRSARLSDLHRIAEDQQDPERGSLKGLLKLFHDSPVFRALAPATQRDYTVSRDLVCGYKTKIGGTFGELQTSRLTPPVIQRLIDAIAETRPTTALHALQYLRRVFRWGLNRGHCGSNPATGIEAPQLKPRRRLPSDKAHIALLTYAAERGSRPAHTAGSCAPYLWACMELAYLCHLRGIELLDMRESQAHADYLLASRRKGSRDTRFRWTPRLRAAWDAAIALRNAAWADHRKPGPLRLDDRPVIVAQDGTALRRSSLDSAWQRFIHAAIRDSIITADERYGLHDLKRKGITERDGTRPEKQAASGHRSAQMLDVYDLSVPLVDPAKAG